MTPEQFKQRLEALNEIILRGLSSHAVTQKLCFHEADKVDWTKEEQNDLLGRFRGFFTPVIFALRDMALMQFAKVFDKDPRTASLTNLLEAATQDPNLVPHISAGELAEIERGVLEASELVEKLQRHRNQRLAHTDANPMPPEPISVGDLDGLAETIRSAFNKLSSGHDRNFYSWSQAVKTSEQETVAILRALLDQEGQRKRRLEDEKVQNGLDHLRRTERKFGHRLDKQTIGEAIKTLGLTNDQMRRVEDEYSSGTNQGVRT